jgi:succinyl-diaminopimelate desuccinylase
LEDGRCVDGGDYLFKHGSSDGGFYSEAGIAAVAFGVGGSGQHGPDEYLEVGSVLPYYRALREFLGDRAMTANA